MNRLTFVRAAFELTKWFIFLVFALLLIHIYLLSVFIVDGPSMLSTLQDKNVVAVNKIGYRLGNPQRGDIVVVRFPGDPEGTYYVKRVIGLPGETVSVANEHVYINGKLLTEVYLDAGVKTLPDQTEVVPADSYYTMGDNRELSNDSRKWGAAEKRFILGKVIATVIPKIKAFPVTSY
ncbi:MAG: signal peptidase I [bacterium]|nr:signal peptidase I [bacterium]